MILSYTKYATNSVVHVDLETLDVTPLTDVPLTTMRGDVLHVINPTSFLVIGSGTIYSAGVYHFTLNDSLEVEMTQVHAADDKKVPPNIVSIPEHVWLKSTKGDPKRPVHGFYWPPHNPKFAAPEGELPPLLINPHGGPTGHTPPGLNIGGIGGGNAQFWTSRGFAYFSINYTGSSGHGKSYRERLDAEWGILDRDDVVEIIRYLCETGRADKDKVGIHGGSAGGYNVLQSLVWYPDVFAAGVCYCGVSDVKALGEGTHKLESHYLEGLLYKPGMSQEERATVEYERSPVLHAERIRAPLLLLHGDKDTVVPIAQSYEIERKIRARGGEVKMIVAPGDGHMFLMEKSKKIALEAEVEWWMRTLVRK
jgi:dipeptidyl aminopeptidase/acylaminoacyl peptidase